MTSTNFTFSEPIHEFQEFKNNVLRIVGGVCAIVGAIGLVLPVLPGVPFLILAVFCFEAIG